MKELQDSTFLSTINVDAKLQDKLKKRYDTRAAQAFESIGNLGNLTVNYYGLLLWNVLVFDCRSVFCRCISSLEG